MKLEGGTHVVQSYTGSVCSILLVLITSVYAIQKILVLYEKKDVDVVLTAVDSFYDMNFVFNYSNGFNVAVAFTGYNNEVEMELDPSYGRLIFNNYRWGMHQNGTFYSAVDELKHHVCSREELGLEPGNNSQDN